MKPEFEAFPDIKKLGTAVLFITQKIHGTNAQVYVFQQEDGTLDLACGSRTRWIAPGDDNYGFAEHVYAHKQEFIDKLGPGRHYGEWAGLGINSGEGLTDKIFVLFDHWRYPAERPLPPKTVVVPVLYAGEFDLGKIKEVGDDLKANGSKLAPGFMRPEGMVVNMKGLRYKVVFSPEETKWKEADQNYKNLKQREANEALEKLGHLLQPIRLEKLLSRDERYMREFPKSMPVIANDYFADLVKEGQVTGTEVEINGIKKQLGGNLFKFIREIAEKQNVAE